MRTAFDTITELDHPREVVWDALTDWELAPRWMPGMTRVDGPEQPSVGDELLLDGERGTRRSQITALEVGRRLELTAVSGPVTARYRYALDGPDEGPVRLRLTGDLAVAGPMRLLGPLMRRGVARADGGQLERFASVLDDDPAAS